MEKGIKQSRDEEINKEERRDRTECRGQGREDVAVERAINQF